MAFVIQGAADPRNNNLLTASFQNAQVWTTGPVAIYVGMSNITYFGSRPTRVDVNKAESVFGTVPPDDFQGSAYQALLTGDVVPTPSQLVNNNSNVFNAFFFGWAEKFPTVRLRPVYRPWRTSTGGDEPHDHFYAGNSAYVQAVMTAWNEGLYAVMQSYTGDFYRGQDLPGAVGRWMGAEGGAFQLFLAFPYSSKGFYTNQPPGYRFLSAWLDPDGCTTGSRERKLLLSWKCQRLFNPADSSYTLYDGNMDALAGVTADMNE